MVFLISCVILAGCATDRGGLDTDAEVATGSGSQSVGTTDSDFARQACQTGAAEVEIGKLAARNTRNAEVRALAKRLSEDHARAEKELARLFARKGIPPERELAQHRQSSLDRLAGLKGREFDTAFKEQVIADHESSIELFEKQAAQGADPDLKAFAQKHLPHLREHLAQAQRLEIGPDTGAQPTAADVLGNPATRSITIPR